MTALAEQVTRIHQLKENPSMKVSLLWITSIQLVPEERHEVARWANAEIQTVVTDQMALEAWKRQSYDGIVIEHLRGDWTLINFLGRLLQEQIQPLTVAVIASNLTDDEIQAYANVGISATQIYDPDLGSQKLAEGLRKQIDSDIASYLTKSPILPGS